MLDDPPFRAPMENASTPRMFIDKDHCYKNVPNTLKLFYLK